MNVNPAYEHLSALCASLSGQGRPMNKEKETFIKIDNWGEMELSLSHGTVEVQVTFPCIKFAFA